MLRKVTVSRKELPFFYSQKDLWSRWTQFVIAVELALPTFIWESQGLAAVGDESIWLTGLREFGNFLGLSDLASDET